MTAQMAGLDLQVLWLFSSCMQKILEQGKQLLMLGPLSSKLFTLPMPFSHSCTHGDTCPCKQPPLGHLSESELGTQASGPPLGGWPHGRGPCWPGSGAGAGVPVILGSRYQDRDQEGGPKLPAGTSHEPLY